jgi:hypothetical protein
LSGVRRKVLELSEIISGGWEQIACLNAWLAGLNSTIVCGNREVRYLFPRASKRKSG